MTILGALWLPIVLSAVFVFFLSAILHMVLKYHNSDYGKLPNEDAVRAAFKGVNAEARGYVVPHCPDMKDMQSPEMQKKFAEGPIAVLYLRRPGMPGMGPSLLQWFLFCLVVSLFVGYVAAHAIPPGADYLHVFRIVGAVGFLAYGVGQMSASIWMAKPWSVAAKEAFDGLLYGLVTAGTFGWLWPK
jgi:Flp pilus assembly protein TadB